MSDPNSGNLHLQQQQFPLDSDVLKDSNGITRLSHSNHGRQIVCSRHQVWITAVVYTQQDGVSGDQEPAIWLFVSRAGGLSGVDFQPPIALVGSGKSKYLFPGNKVANCCLLKDSQDRIDLVYEDATGIHVLTADSGSPDCFNHLSNSKSWKLSSGIAPAGSVLGDAMTLKGEGKKLAIYYSRENVLYEKINDAEPDKIGKGNHPSAYETSDGVRHVAFEQDRQIYYVRRSSEGRWTDSTGRNGAAEKVAYYCSSYPSLAVTSNGTIVIAYQGEGKVDLKLAPDRSAEYRKMSGSAIAYAVKRPQQDGWRIHELVRSSEILLKRYDHWSTPDSFRNQIVKYLPAAEELWRPSLAVDRHGVIWLFYVNATRRHTFFARFQGEVFGDRFEARGPYDALSRFLFVQKDASESSAIATMVLAAGQLYFDTIPVPTFSSQDTRRIVFLDNLEIDEMVGVEHCPGKWTKHDKPVYGYGISGNSVEDDQILWCEVFPAENGFEMQYMTYGKLYNNALLGRAHSKDGIHWTKSPAVDASRVYVDGKPMDRADNFWRPVYIEDPEEKSPARRFKGMIGCYRFLMVNGQKLETRSWDVITSPDGFEWTRVPDLPIVLVGDISCNMQLYRDVEDADPNRRFKMIMINMSTAGRNISVFTSPDAIHWSQLNHVRRDPEDLNSGLSPLPSGPHVLDPDASENPWEEELHDAIMWRENGLLMFHYDAFYTEGNQHINKALAISRDGRHYWRIKRGVWNLPHGSCGEFDSGRCRTTRPVHVGDEWRLYYCGMPASGFADPDKDDPRTVNSSPFVGSVPTELRPWKVGLARLRQDGWGYLQRERDSSSGYVTTIPFEYVGGRLVVNGTGLDSQRIQFELLSVSGNFAPVKGYEKGKSVVSTKDSVNAGVTWPGNAPLRNSTYRLRIWLEDSAVRLYSLGFQA